MDAAAKTALAREEEPLVEHDAPQIRDPQPEPGAPETSGPAQPWNKVRELALKQLDRFMSLEPKVLRGDDPDAIHDLRVASRRLQQVLDLLYPGSRHGAMGKLRRRIRRSRRALGDVRNADVQLERVHQILARKRSARREAWEAVRDYMVDHRSEEFAKAVRKLSRQNLAVFYIHLKDFLTRDDGEQQPHPTYITSDGDEARTESFETRVSRSLAAVWQAFEAKVAESHRDSQAAVIHGVRIAAKRLRYLVEVLYELKTPGSSETLAWLRRLQELLGDWHDLEVLEQMLVAMVARPAYLRENLPTAMEVEKLILKNRANKGRFRELYYRQTLEGAEYQKVRNWAENLELKIEN